MGCHLLNDGHQRGFKIIKRRPNGWMYVTKIEVVNQCDILRVLVDFIPGLSPRIGQPVVLVEPTDK
jgi:hypothetical protein